MARERDDLARERFGVREVPGSMAEPLRRRLEVRGDGVVDAEPDPLFLESRAHGIAVRDPRDEEMVDPFPVLPFDERPDGGAEPSAIERRDLPTTAIARLEGGELRAAHRGREFVEAAVVAHEGVLVARA